MRCVRSTEAVSITLLGLVGGRPQSLPVRPRCVACTGLNRARCSVRVTFTCTQQSVNGHSYRLLAYPICRSVCVSVSLSVRWVNCGKTADWIWMLFGVVSGVSQRMGVLDESGDRRGSFGSNVGHHTVTNGDFVT